LPRRPGCRIIFLRFWRDTKDRFFLYFAISFFVEGLNRFALAMTGDPNEGRPFFYFVRFVSFVLILIPIVDKNLAERPADQNHALAGAGAPGSGTNARR
jgi:hypothetical protein